MITVYKRLFLFRDPDIEEHFDVPITADRTRNIPASNIRWTNKPPRRTRTAAENVGDPGIFLDGMILILSIRLNFLYRRPIC
jgi:hypothetical protein